MDHFDSHFLLQTTSCACMHSQNGEPAWERALRCLSLDSLEVSHEAANKVPSMPVASETSRWRLC